MSMRFCKFCTITHFNCIWQDCCCLPLQFPCHQAYPPTEWLWSSHGHFQKPGRVNRVENCILVQYRGIYKWTLRSVLKIVSDSYSKLKWPGISPWSIISTHPPGTKGPIPVRMPFPKPGTRSKWVVGEKPDLVFTEPGAHLQKIIPIIRCLKL